jgi:predicted ArsR family transcriptional regulator
MPEPSSIEVHKALADDTRYRLYRYLRLSGRPVPIRELAARLSLHPNTLRPHLRRLEEVGLVTSETLRGPSAGRPQIVYAVVARDEHEGRDYRLLADILTGLLRGGRARERAAVAAREWGEYLAAQASPRPAGRRPAGPDLAALQAGLSDAGFDPRFRRRDARTVEISLRDCPFRDLVEDHRDLVCAVHRGLLEGLLAGSRPPLTLVEFEPLGPRATCRLVARGGPAGAPTAP